MLRTDGFLYSGRRFLKRGCFALRCSRWCLCKCVTARRSQGVPHLKHRGDEVFDLYPCQEMSGHFEHTNTSPGVEKEEGGFSRKHLDSAACQRADHLRKHCGCDSSTFWHHVATQRGPTRSSQLSPSSSEPWRLLRKGPD